MQITPDQLETLSCLIAFVQRPITYGCSIDYGDALTFDDRVGRMFAAAEKTLDALKASA